MWIGVAVTFVASFALSLYWTIHAPQLAYYLMPSRIWQFCLGAFTFLILHGEAGSRPPPTRKDAGALTWLVPGTGLLMILGSAVTLHSDMAYPGLWALGPSIGAALIILAGRWRSMTRGPLVHVWLVWLGDRSYSLYLWHWPVLILGSAYGLSGEPLATAGLVVLSVLAAALSYRFVERPVWKGKAGKVEPHQILLASILVMVSAVFNANQLMDYITPQETLAEMRNRWRADSPRLYRRQCDAFYAHARVEPCEFGPQEAERTVVLIGDSIGVQWFSTVREVFREPVWKTVVLTKSACALVDEDYYYGKSIYQVCTDWRNAALDWMDTTRPDVIVMGSAIGYDFTEAQWVEGTRRVLHRMSAAADSVIVIPGTPVLGIHGPGCVSRQISESKRVTLESCMAGARTQRARTIAGYLEKSAAAYSNVHVLDLTDLVCPGGRCGAISADGLLVYRDTQHLSDTFVWAQSPMIRERLLRLLRP